MANPLIFQQWLKEPKSAAEYAAEYGAADTARQTNAFNQLVMGEKMRGFEDQNRLRQLYQSNPNATPEQLRAAGFRDEAAKAEGAALETQKTKSGIGLTEAQTGKATAETAAKTADMAYEKVARHAQNAAGVQTPEDVVAYIDRGIAEGVPGFTPEKREQALANFQKIGSVEAWKKAAMDGAIPVVEQFKAKALLAQQERDRADKANAPDNVIHDGPQGPVLVDRKTGLGRDVTYGAAPGGQPPSGQPVTGGLDALKASIFQQESSSGTADTSKPNYAGARGPMQMMPATFEGLKRTGAIPANYDINNPEHNKAAGNALIDQLSAQYDGNPLKIAAAYYAGPKAVNADGTINRNYRDLKNPNAPNVGQYLDQVNGRMQQPQSPPVAGTTQAPGTRVQGKETWGSPVASTRQDGSPVLVQSNSKTGEVREVPGFGPKDGGAGKATPATDARDALALIEDAKKILPNSTGSGLGSAIDATGRFFGKSTAGGDAAAQLKVISGALVSKMPKMSGPQSDADVKLYKEMAAQIGDDTVPVASRLKALETLTTIQNRYARGGGATGSWGPRESASNPALDAALSKYQD